MSKALSVSFDGHGIDSMRERIAARKQTKQVSEDATKTYEPERKGLEGHEEGDHRQ